MFKGTIMQCFAALPKSDRATLTELYCSRAQNSTKSLVCVINGNHYVHLSAEDDVFTKIEEWI